jgi:hypothetical protein
LRHPVDLTFILENTDNELLNVTEPFAGSKFESLISGRNSFACYFDNMNADLAVDTTLELSADGTSGTIKDVFFLYPEILTIPVSKASKIKTQAIAPGGAVKEFVPKSSESGYIEAVFPPGAYQVECIGGTPVGPERALIYKDFQQARALGMVRIFKDSSIDYSQQVDYTITFQKVNKNQN